MEVSVSAGKFFTFFTSLLLNCICFQLFVTAQVVQSVKTPLKRYTNLFVVYQVQLAKTNAVSYKCPAIKRERL